ncbi:MAG: putative nucleotidyltransferase substrate binding domain-containing protein [Sulfurovaceae bacterium]|nr:putative nucleotidyltransferase substrate binding domain-containing protein [Sulfurovaceae bacterium]MDD5549323.1 putative nucleotidyltransferase substrate binding domain-containing protein [Sulfurovaceae bacterium]
MNQLLDSLKEHLPFSILDDMALEILRKNTKIGYYPNNSVLVLNGHAFEFVYIVIKGQVEARSDGELLDIYSNNDVFGAIEILKNELSTYEYTVSEELICFELNKNTFFELCDKYTEFRDYFFLSLVERANSLKNKKEYESMGDLMISRLDRSILHQACIIDGSTPVAKALETMENARVSSILVKNREGYGIVTDADLRYYILNSDSIDNISQIQTYPMISTTEGEFLFNILLLMTQKSIKHLPVFSKNKELIGVLELIDLLSFFSNQTYLVNIQMQNANTLEDVIKASSRLEVMVRALHSKGVKSRYIARIVSDINKRMYNKLFSLILPKEWQENASLILLGSEGRSEQILRTDQDNAIIFKAGFKPNNIQEITTKFVEALDAIGFPRCAGNVMIINPMWCKSIDEYKTTIDEWCEHPNYENIMDMAILFDSFSVAGDDKIHNEVMGYLKNSIDSNPILIRHLAKSIENFDSAIGIFSQFVTSGKGHRGEIDIKKSAIFPMIHGIRTLAIEYKIEVTNTYERIKELNNLGFFNREDAHDMIESLEILNSIRLNTQLSLPSSAISNYISINSLSKIQRDLLKDALKTVSKFKKTIQYHYKLSLVG